MGIEYLKGHLYFMVSYSDESLKIPSVDPLVFIGKNIEDDKEDKWYFQDAESFASLGAYPNLSNKKGDKGNVNIFSFRDIDLCHVKDPQGLADELNDCLNRW